MDKMSREDFLKMVSANESGEWVEGERLAAELDLHFSERASILAWLWVLSQEVLAVVTEHHILLVDVREHYRTDPKAIIIESVPMSRVRSVKTSSNHRIEIDFANPVFSDHGPVFRGCVYDSTFSITNTGDEQWPSDDVKRFLRAVANTRR